MNYVDMNLILTSDAQMAELRTCKQNPTYIISMVERNIPREEQKKLEIFIAEEIIRLCQESIWADPKNPR